MAKNGIFTRLKFVLEAVIAASASGDPVLVGTEGLHGVALTDSETGTNKVAVDVGQSVYDLAVKGIDGTGDAAIAIGDKLYYTAGDTPKLNKKTTGTFFGYALEAVAAGATATINVLVVQ